MTTWWSFGVRISCFLIISGSISGNTQWKSSKFVWYRPLSRKIWAGGLGLWVSGNLEALEVRGMYRYVTRYARRTGSTPGQRVAWPHLGSVLRTPLVIGVCILGYLGHLGCDAKSRSTPVMMPKLFFPLCSHRGGESLTIRPRRLEAH